MRAEIAKAAGVCVANVTKAKRLIDSADASVLTALQVGEIRIHRAWTWLEASKDGGLQAYKTLRNETGMRRTIKTLIAQQVARKPPAPDELNELRNALRGLSSKPLFKPLVRSMECVLEAFDSQSLDRPVHSVALRPWGAQSMHRLLRPRLFLTPASRGCAQVADTEPHLYGSASNGHLSPTSRMLA